MVEPEPAETELPALRHGAPPVELSLRSPPVVPGRARSKVWREEALLRAAELQSLLSSLVQVSERSPQQVDVLVAAASEHIGVATDTAVGRSVGPWWRRLLTSLQQERAYGHLAQAEAVLLRLAPEPYVRAQVRLLVARVRRLPLGDARRTFVEYLVRRPGDQPLSEGDRENLIAAVLVADAAGRREIVRVRSMRNLLALIAAVLFTLATALALAGLARPQWLPVCYVPGDRVVCVTDTVPVAFGFDEVDDLIRATAGPVDLLIVELAGLLGAALSAARLVRRFPGRSIPYNPVVTLMLVKLPIGALTAVLGLLMIGAGFIPGFTALDSAGQILAWAVIFGFAQQLFTKPLDDQVLHMLSSVESPTGHDPSDLDTQTAEAFTSAVSATLSSSAPSALRDALAGPRLVNFSGWLALHVQDAEGREELIDSKAPLRLDGGATYALQVVVGAHKEEAGLSRRLQVTEGVDDDPVRFTVDCDSNDSNVRQPRQPLVVGARHGRAVAEFPLSFSDDLSVRWLWVRVRQGDQVVLQVELEVRTDDRSLL